MATVITPPDVRSEKPAPNLFPERLRDDEVPQEQSSLVGSVLRGTLLVAFAAGALTLFAFALVPVVFVTLMILVFALAPVIFLGLAIVFTEDLYRDTETDASGQPCSCHHDRIENTFSKR